MLSRKHFKLIADAIATARRDCAADAARHNVPMDAGNMASAAINALADALATTNPRFNRDKFVTACWRGKAKQ